MLDAAARAERGGDLAGPRPKIERQRKVSAPVIEPVGQPIGCLTEQEIMRADTQCRALAPPAEQPPVEHVDTFRHGRNMSRGREKATCQGCRAPRRLTGYNGICPFCQSAVLPAGCSI